MAFGNKQEEINELNRTVAIQDGQIRELQGQIAVLQCVEPIAVQVLEELTRLDKEGILDEAAQTAAAVAVATQESHRLTEELTERLTDEKYTYFAAQFRAEKGPALRAGLVSLFESDGTFEDLKAKAEDDIQAEIQAEILEEATAKARAEVDTEEARAGYKQKIQKEIDESDEIEQFRVSAREQLEQVWRDEGVEETKTKVKSEEAQREQAFKEWFAEEYKKSHAGRQFIERTKARLEELWREKTLEEVAVAIGDQVLLDLLSKRAELATAKLQEETAAAELLEKFDGRGLDTSNIPEGVDLVIYLGEKGTSVVEEIQKDRNGYVDKVKVKKPTVYCKRKLELTSLGGGRFIVDNDSLSDEESPYEKEEAIDGKVIVVGREVVEDEEPILEKRIALGVTLFFDTNTKDSKITSSLLPVANVEVDGISAHPGILVEMV